MIRFRRSALKFMAGAAAVAASRSTLAEAKPGFAIRPGPFEGTRESLREYTAPEWFRDAKFGIWAHWGPQSVPEDGDWYARNMYLEGSAQYKFHVQHYGHPSQVGFKNVIAKFKADRWDPEHLMDLYKKAGAKYFVSMGVHHDNFDMWNSKYQTRWNAMKVGPHKDIVGMWKKAAARRGMKFGVSEHLWISYKWFGVAHGADLKGDLRDVPYDGHDPRYFDLYHESATAEWARGDFAWNDVGIPEAWKQHWFLRMKDLVDNYEPDLLYSDGQLPFENYGCSAVANLYNISARLHGKNQAVYTCKNEEDCSVGTCVLDFESGLANAIRQDPWQTDTCIGGWHYSKNLFLHHRYKPAKTVIDLLVDIVSQNGNLLLNIPLPNNGVPDSDELEILAGITAWMKVNSEGIYGTRPWRIYGEGPSIATNASSVGAKFNERRRKPLTADDVRFTIKGPNTLYAFVMGWPRPEKVIEALGTASAQSPNKIQNVELLGYDGKVTFTQEPGGLRVQLPAQAPSEYGVTLKITM